MSNWQSLIQTLKNHNVDFAPGLTESETALVESRLEFTFPEDLREFLQTALPCGPQFPDWRACEKATLESWFNLPREGVLFDVARNDFWLQEWGERPENLDEANAVVNALIDAAPKLIPINMHRMMAADPTTAGNPIFSVHQTDIIVYGTTLAEYFSREFSFRKDEIDDDWATAEHARKIRFWDIDRFQDTRWGHGGSCEFDNSGGILP